MSTWSFQSRLKMGPDTEERNFRLFIASFAAFAVATPIALLVLDMLSIRTYLLAAFCWLLITSEIFAPVGGDSSWWIRLQWIKAGGWIVFLYIVVERFLAVLL